MSWISEYRLDTGEFTGRSFSGADCLSQCLAEGCGYVQGQFYAATHVYDLQAMAVVERELVVDDTAVVERQARQNRDVLLAQADGMVMRAIEQSLAATGAIDIPGNIIQYKQALRDLPNTAGWPRNIVWPEKPS